MPLTSRLRTAETVRTKIGLFFLLATQTYLTILYPLQGLAPHPFGPIVSYNVDQIIWESFILLLFIGQVLIVSGRTAFGPRHSQNSVLALALWMFVAINELFLISNWLPALATGLPGSVVFALWGIVSSAISVTALALLTYNLQSTKGKMLLWSALVTGIGLAIAFDSQNLHIFPYYSNVIQRTIWALGAVSTALFAGAFILAWSRIRRGKTAPFA